MNIIQTILSLNKKDRSYEQPFYLYFLVLNFFYLHVTKFHWCFSTED